LKKDFKRDIRKGFTNQKDHNAYKIILVVIFKIRIDTSINI
jgi:hypothetical protein